MLRALLVLPLWLAACSFDGSVPFFGDDDSPDAGGDARQPEECETWSTDLFDPCDVDEPTGSLTLTGDSTYNTETGELRTDGMLVAHASSVLTDRTPNVHVLSTREFRMDERASTLRVTGSLPLLIAAREGIVISGTIDVSSNELVEGAGANAPQCSVAEVAAGPGGQDNNGAGGGGGGGFGGNGGNGGAGDGGDGAPGTRGNADSDEITIRGGCPGAKGGDGHSGTVGAAPGSGGGALVLATPRSITIAGRLLAGGAGGRGASDNEAGGGGGGSGGLLGFDAASIAITNAAVLAANGGGGGGGTGSNSSPPGTAGLANADLAPGGIPSGNDGGIGGAGGALSPQAGGVGETDDNDGGGGGGGGSGVIIVFRGLVDVVPPAVVSPALR